MASNFRMTQMQFGVLTLMTVMHSIRTQSISLWQDAMNTQPASSDWTYTSAVLSTSSTGCASSQCWLISGGGSLRSPLIDTTNFNGISLQFNLNVVNLSGNDRCLVEYYSDTGSTLSGYSTQAESNPRTLTNFPASSSADGNVYLRFENTGKQSTDYCYIDDVILHGSYIVQPTSSPVQATTATTKSPAVAASSTSTPTASVGGSGNGNPAGEQVYTPSPTPSPKYSAASARDYEKSTLNLFQSWGTFGIFIAVCTALAAMGFTPWTFSVYFWLKTLWMSSCGSETSGVIKNKYMKRHVRKKKHQRATVTFTYWIVFDYEVSDKTYVDERKVLAHGEWSGMQIGQHVTVKYVMCCPRCTAKEAGGMGFGGTCYCSPLTLCCVLAIIPWGIFIVVCALLSGVIANMVDLAIVTLVCSFSLCAIPCCLYYVIGDCSATVEKGYEQAPQTANI